MDDNVKREQQEAPQKAYGKKISIENLIFTISVEFSRLKIGVVEKDLEPPVLIGTKEIKVKNFGSSP
jgi:hypothetical protein